MNHLSQESDFRARRLRDDFRGVGDRHAIFCRAMFTSIDPTIRCGPGSRFFSALNGRDARVKFFFVISGFRITGRLLKESTNRDDRSAQIFIFGGRANLSAPIIFYLLLIFSPPHFTVQSETDSLRRL